MAYKRTNWKSGAEGGTLVTDERLNNIEDGIQQALAGIPDVALPDAVMTAVAEDPTSQFAIQQNATFVAGQVVSTDGTDGLPEPTGVGMEFVRNADGLDDIRMNGVSL